METANFNEQIPPQGVNPPKSEPPKGRSVEELTDNFFNNYVEPIKRGSKEGKPKTYGELISKKKSSSSTSENYFDPEDNARRKAEIRARARKRNMRLYGTPTKAIGHDTRTYISDPYSNPLDPEEMTKYDKGINWAHINSAQDLEDRREANQNGWDLLGNAGANFVSGVGEETLANIGYIYGAATRLVDRDETLAEKGFIESIVDNPISNYAREAGERWGDRSVTYRNEEQKNGNLLEQLTDSTMYATTGADVAAFGVSAFGPGLLTKLVKPAKWGMKALAKGTRWMDSKVARNTYLNLSKFGNKVSRSKLGKALNLNSNGVDNFIGATVNSNFEALSGAHLQIRDFEEMRDRIVGDRLAGYVQEVQGLLESGQINEAQAREMVANRELSLNAEFDEQKSRLARDVYSNYMGVLMPSNLLQMDMIFGKWGKAVSPTAKRKMGLKGLGTIAGTSLLSEGFYEEGLQTTAENELMTKAENFSLSEKLFDLSELQIGSMNLKDYLVGYAKTISSTEGQLAIAMGGMMGTGMTSIMKNIENRSYNKRLDQFLGDETVAQASAIVPDIVENDVWKRDANGKKIVNDKTGKFEIDSRKVHKTMQGIAENAAMLKEFEIAEKEATEKGDSTRLGRLYDQVLVSTAAAYATQGEMGIEALKELTESQVETAKTNESNTPEDIAIIEENGNALIELAEAVPSYVEAYDEYIGGRGLPKAKTEKAKKYQEEYISKKRVQYVTSRLLEDVYSKKIKDLDKDIRKFKKAFGENPTTRTDNIRDVIGVRIAKKVDVDENGEAYDKEVEEFYDKNTNESLGEVTTFTPEARMKEVTKLFEGYDVSKKVKKNDELAALEYEKSWAEAAKSSLEQVSNKHWDNNSSKKEFEEYTKEQDAITQEAELMELHSEEVTAIRSANTLEQLDTWESSYKEALKERGKEMPEPLANYLKIYREQLQEAKKADERKLAEENRKRASKDSNIISKGYLDELMMDGRYTDIFVLMDQLELNQDLYESLMDIMKDPLMTLEEKEEALHKEIAKILDEKKKNPDTSIFKLLGEELEVSPTQIIEAYTSMINMGEDLSAEQLVQYESYINAIYRLADAYNLELSEDTQLVIDNFIEYLNRNGYSFDENIDSDNYEVVEYVPSSAVKAGETLDLDIINKPLIKDGKVLSKGSKRVAEGTGKVTNEARARNLADPINYMYSKLYHKLVHELHQKDTLDGMNEDLTEETPVQSEEYSPLENVEMDQNSFQIAVQSMNEETDRAFLDKPHVRLLSHRVDSNTGEIIVIEGISNQDFFDNVQNGSKERVGTKVSFEMTDVKTHPTLAKDSPISMIAIELFEKLGGDLNNIAKEFLEEVRKYETEILDHLDPYGVMYSLDGEVQLSSFSEDTLKDFIYRYLPIQAVTEDGYKTSIEAYSKGRKNGSELGRHIFNTKALPLRMSIIDNMVKSKDGYNTGSVTSEITYQRKEGLNLQKTEEFEGRRVYPENSISEINGVYNLNNWGVGRTNGQMTTVTNSMTAVVEGDHYVSGELYLLTPTANGEVFPLKTNTSRLSDNEIDGVFEVLQTLVQREDVENRSDSRLVPIADLSESAKANLEPHITFLYDILGDTKVAEKNAEILLGLVTHFNTDHPKTNIALTEEGGITFGSKLSELDSSIPIGMVFNEETLKQHEASIKQFLKFKRRNVVIGGSVTTKSNQNLVRAGITLDNPLYLKYVIDSKGLNTNATVMNGSPFSKGSLFVGPLNQKTVKPAKTTKKKVTPKPKPPTTPDSQLSLFDQEGMGDGIKGTVEVEKDDKVPKEVKVSEDYQAITEGAKEIVKKVDKILEDFNNIENDESLDDFDKEIALEDFLNDLKKDDSLDKSIKVSLTKDATTLKDSLTSLRDQQLKDYTDDKIC